MKVVYREKLSISSSRKPHLFLSHNHKNKNLVRKLATDINLFGIDVWLDEWEIEIGDSLHESIGRAIEKSRYIGIVVTPEFVKSKWCKDELLQALSREKREDKIILLPLLFEYAQPIPFIDDRLYLDFSTNYLKSLAHLCALIYDSNPRMISNFITIDRIMTMRDVEWTLKRLGWDGIRKVDYDEFQLLKKLLKEAMDRNYLIGNLVVDIQDETLRYYKELGLELLKEFPNNPIVKKLFGIDI